MIDVCLPDEFVKAALTGGDNFIRSAAESIYRSSAGDCFSSGSNIVLADDGVTGKIACALFAIMRQNGLDAKLIDGNCDYGAYEAENPTEFGGEKVGCIIGSCGHLVDMQRQILFSAMQRQPKPFYIAIGAPYGTDAVTGDVCPDALKANITVAPGAVFSGLLTGAAPDYAGRIVATDFDSRISPCGKIADKTLAKPAKRALTTHKGNCGKISVVGGCDCMPGAPLMAYYSAAAASRCGAGLVRLCVGENEKCAYKSRVTEQTLFFLPEKEGFIAFDAEKFDDIAKWSDVVVIGPGMGKNPYLAQILAFLCGYDDLTLVADADALNAAASHPHCLAEHRCRLILTPHIGEFARLAPAVRQYDINAVRAFAAGYGCTLVLKSARTIITDGNRVYFNVTGCPAQAKGGSGDLLAGAIGAFAAVNNPLNAAVSACYYMGIAAERVSCAMRSDVSVLAGDIIGSIGKCGFTEYDEIIQNLVVDNLT